MEIQRADALYARDWCLSSLMAQAEGRHIDTLSDQFLIEQINASHVDDLDGEAITECQVGGCALVCLSSNDSGILQIRVQAGEAVCNSEL